MSDSFFRRDLNKTPFSFLSTGIDASKIPSLALSIDPNTPFVGPIKTSTSTSSTKPSFFSNNVSFSSSADASSQSTDSQSNAVTEPSFFSNNVSFSSSVDVPSQSTDSQSNAVNETSPLTPEEKIDIGSGLGQQTLKDFSDLLSRLEASKMKQERKKAVETRQDTMAKGLASMLGNF